MGGGMPNPAKNYCILGEKWGVQQEISSGREALNPSFARVMCQRVGVYLTPTTWDGDGLAVVGVGTGIVLAFADHLERCYPGLPLVLADLPGYVGFEARCVALDYVLSTYPAVVLMWSSLRSGEDYPRYLRQVRGCCPQRAWAYVRGLGKAQAKSAWAEMGVEMIEQLWRDRPLGNLSPRQTSRPWELLQGGK